MALHGVLAKRAWTSKVLQTLASKAEQVAMVLAPFDVGRPVVQVISLCQVHVHMQFKTSIAEEASDLVLDDPMALSFKCPVRLNIVKRQDVSFPPRCKSNYREAKVYSCQITRAKGREWMHSIVSHSMQVIIIVFRKITEPGVAG